ncbi:DNA-3-methyladenine glycosylase [Ignavigranum ruoffiae]|uniref:DNA-3-methyladenine glycosylase n=1 Tax=Ignavigranum ruoffiae TaxID=89093 RepID=UPI0024AE43C4|nr:DNA-3-methyladenine glycosylase [Ignavigranum ruoffiae]
MIPDWFNRDTPTTELAQNLIGCLLVHESDEGRCSGWIVETEAYLGFSDQASHSYQGKHTPRLSALYQGLGVFYLYQMRGHILINVVSGYPGQGTGVMIRALEPYQGRDLMAQRRGKSGILISNGPAKLSQALGINMSYYGQSVHGPGLRIDFSQRLSYAKLGVGPRIGIPNKGEWTHKPLRYYIEGHPYLSK